MAPRETAYHDIGAQVEALLAELSSGVRGPDAAAIGEQLVGLLVDFYGDGLARIVELAGPEAAHRLAGDPLAEALLLLHGLHPLTVEQRVEAALDRVRPYLGSHAGGVAFLGVDGEGVARLRLDGSCHGCQSSTVTVKLTIEQAVLAAAPELSAIAVDGEVEQPTLMQIGLRPGAAPAPAWLHPSAPELPSEGSVAAVHLDGRQILMARHRGRYLAYSDACAACGSSLVTGVLDGALLTCPACAARFDIHLAGTAVDGSGRQLDPLPLLDDVSGIRIALLPEPV